ncbi:hypothetical protein KFE25_014284 [Diacronema lutheri]|uniref:Uncharacterized protein n=2 Tax=Diacronema lutheri TaxID=2081491 RepID=A0A8J5X9Y7_DIALT|nr:hypothetical protein KFE25_014284 [Diacronema lutheri]
MGAEVGRVSTSNLLALLLVSAAGFVQPAPARVPAVGRTRSRALALAMATRIEVVGDIGDVIAGRVPAVCERQVLMADALRCAFIVGSPKGLDSMGEMLAVNGRAYCCSTEPESGKHSLLVGAGVYTTGACVLPLGARPDGTLERGEDTPPTPWGALCREALEAVDGARAVVLSGFVDFAPLACVQVARSPIHGKSILARRDGDCAVPPRELARARAFVMGAVAPSHVLDDGAERDAASPTERAFGAGMRRVLCAGGAGIAGAERAGAQPALGAVPLSSYAHGLVLARAGILAEAQVVPDAVRSVVHISAESVVLSAALELFAVSGVVDHVAGLEYVPRACC